jgi:hypothetical protein
MAVWQYGNMATWQNGNIAIWHFAEFTHTPFPYAENAKQYAEYMQYNMQYYIP